MKDPIKEQERNIKILMSIVGIILLITSIAVACYDYYLEQRSVSLNGKIESLNYVDGKNKATVSFSLTGHEHKASITIKNDKYAVDDKIIVKVDMYNPEKEIINNHYYIYIPGLIISIIIMSISLPSLIKYYKRQKYCKELKNNGFFVNATITAVFINNNDKLKRKGSYPFRLRAKYFNPQTNSEFVFESEDTYVNLNDPITEYQKSTVAVYLNQNDIKNYYVDLDSLYPPLNIVDPIALMGPKTEIKFNFGTKKKEEKTEEETNNPPEQ